MKKNNVYANEMKQNCTERVTKTEACIIVVNAPTLGKRMVGKDEEVNEKLAAN